jgi:Spy/CpxP family protein refolding chaperone
MGIVLAGLGVLALAGGTALAGGAGKGGRFYKHISAKVERALQAVNATPEQRAAIEQAKLQAFAAIKPLKHQMKSRRAEIRQLRDSGSADQTRLQQLISEQKLARAQIRTTVQTFMANASAQLTAPQKKLLEDFVTQHGDLFHVNKRFKRGPATAPAAPAPAPSTAG